VTRSPSRFLANSHPGVYLFRRFCGTKTLGWQNLVFWAQNQQRTHHKVGTARPPKAIHTATYAEGAWSYTHKATDNRHTECAGLPWWSFGLRRTSFACGGSPHTFCTTPTQFLSFVPYAWCKTYGRPSADDPCTPRAERPPRQPRTLSVTIVGCSMDIWARTLRVDRGMDGFRGPSGAHFMVCSLLVLGPKYHILPSRRFCTTKTLEKRNAWMRNG
jgi:hypothetical protein